MIGERRATLLLLLIFCVSILVNMPKAMLVKAEPKTIVVPDDYSNIQEAIDKASIGDIIFVKSGTYHNQSIVINKTLSLIGEDAKTTIIEGLNISYKVQPPLTIVIQVVANEVTIKGFTITKALVGINANADGTQISGNIINEVTDGLKINGSFNNISENTIQPVVIGIELHGSSSTISGNNCHNGRGGIFIIGNINRIESNNITNCNFGIDIGNGSDNIVSQNRVAGNVFGGISISTGVNNKISENQIENNGWGVLIGENPNLIAANNVVYHNNFINNTLQVRTDLSGDEINYWDDGKEGNFWSNYIGTDDDGDGIGDIPYIIDENNQDNYPLMEPFIIPEFPSWILLPLFVVATLLVAIVRDKLLKKV